MFKRILLPLDGSVYSESATRRACEVALAHGAEATGLVILNTPELIDEQKLPFNAQLLDLEKRGYFKRKAQAQKRPVKDSELDIGKLSCKEYPLSAFLRNLSITT